MATLTTSAKPKALKKLKQSFTPLIISSFQCPYGKSQFLYWDMETPNFGVRVTANGNKAYIFESSLNNKTIRITLGNVKDSSLEDARQRAVKLKSLIRTGVDPRELQNKRVPQWVSAKDLNAKKLLKTETVKTVWLNYANAKFQPIIAVKSWSKRRYDQHLILIDTVLAPLASIKIGDLSVAHIKAWGHDLSNESNSHVRFNAKLCLAFLKWCHEHEVYQAAVPDSMLSQMTEWVKSLQETSAPRFLSRALIAAWFKAVDTIAQSEVNVFLKTLLLTGRRVSELTQLTWDDVDFAQHTLTVRKLSGEQTKLPLTKTVSKLLQSLPKTDGLVFKTVINPEKNDLYAYQWHQKICEQIGTKLSLDDLFTSFTLFSEWVETPAGITAQLQDIDIKVINAHHFAKRPLEVLQIWHQKIEDWILKQK